MKKKIKVTKLTIEAGNRKVVELDLQEAKDLYDQLHELFGEKTKYLPGNPIVIDRYPRDPWRPAITCESSQSKIIGNSGLAVTYSGNMQ